MCRRALLAGLIAALLPSGASLDAQDDRAALQQAAAQQRVVVDSLLRESARLKKIVDTWSSERTRLRAIEDPIDTVQVGPFRVIGAQSARKEWVPALEEAWAVYARQFQSLENRLGRRSIELFAGRFPRIVDAGAAGENDASLNRRVAVDLSASHSAHVDLAHRVIGREIVAILPARLQRWVRRDWTPPGQTTRVYRELATAGGDAGTRCFRGETEACISALGLENGGDWSDWYTPAQLRDIVRDRTRYSSAAWHGCVKGSDSACYQYFRDRNETPPGPMRVFARHDLLYWAFQNAGPGSVERLLAAGDSIDAAAALELVTGRVLSDVIADWRGHVEDARPRALADTGKAGVATLVGVLVLSFFATRSTRWRVG